MAYTVEFIGIDTVTDDMDIVTFTVDICHQVTDLALINNWKKRPYVQVERSGAEAKMYDEDDFKLFSK